jgi:hypothetical protein
MSDDVRDLYEALSNEVGALYQQWNMFSNLYGEESRLNLLNESAPAFFSVCLNSIILGISRLTDPSPMTGSKQNLTLERLIFAINPSSPELKHKLINELQILKERCNFARHHRNRRVAHLDLGTYFQENALSSFDITKEKIEEALASIAGIMNEVAYLLNLTEIGYEYLTNIDGVEALVACLEDAKAYHDRMMI